ncbi:MAG: SDR family NAD(P)-dependent oxidoreductase [Solobacterium sp.]|nr:SDR family NAD(P)-dependent oxidoreductase [Solobacterium sp.]
MGTVLITGSSRGLGLSFARLCAKRGDAVLLHGRNEQRLLQAQEALKSEVPGADIRYFVQDLAEEDGALKLYEQVKDLGVTMLINNAGVGYTGPAAEISAQREKNMVQINVLAVVQMTRLFLADMKECGGTILNISSTGAFQYGPLIAEYYASKSFVLSYTKAAAREWQGTPVCICCFCPGPLRTDFYAESGLAVPRIAMDPDQAAEYALSHIRHGAVIIPDLLSRAVRVLPERLRSEWVWQDKKRALRKKHSCMKQR